MKTSPTDVSVLQRFGPTRLLIAGAKALASAFWCDVMDGLVAHGASLGGLAPDKIGPTNCREAEARVIRASAAAAGLMLLGTGVRQTYKSGGAVLESVRQWHEGVNPGSDMLRLLGIDLLEKGAENTVRRNSPPE